MVRDFFIVYWYDFLYICPRWYRLTYQKGLMSGKIKCKD